MPDPLRLLEERLLRAGIAPSRVARYAGELRDHLDDLVDELTAAGLSPTDARDAARRRLGDPEALALPMLVDRRFRSFAARLPGLVYLALPLIAQVGIVALLAAAIVAFARFDAPLADLGALAALLLLLAPVAIGWLVTRAALRRRAALAWPLLGIAATILLGAALQLQLTLPSSAGSGAVAVTLAAPAMAQLALHALLTLTPLLLLARNLRIS